MRVAPNSSFSYPVTFGCSSAKLKALRDTFGRFLTSTELIVRPMSTRPGEAMAASAVTCTTSVTVPTDNSKLTVAVWPALMVTPARSAERNPCKVARIE